VLDATAAIRTAGDHDVPPVVDLLRRAGFGSTVGRLLEWPRHSPSGTILLAEGRDGPAGCVCCASFGSTGWIGALGVQPAMRRRGLGSALTEAATAWLRERGAVTVLLYATEQGRPVYERLGFEPEGRATAWRGTGRGARHDEVRRLGEDARAAVRALDATVTGEDRSPVIDAVRPLAGLGTYDGSLSGWAMSTPWGSGAAICASDPDAGVALMAAATREPGTGTLVVPDTNEAACDAMQRWRFTRLNDALRMRLGPEVAWQPRRQFGLFNLFWG
jgi:GNAT superfamily N-acetyltransferase